MNASFSRRQFLKISFSGAGVLLLPPWTRTAFGDPDPLGESEPHFFLHIVLQGGLDNTYLFDARPLAMTAAGLQTNYSGEEPIEWIGAHGTKLLRTRATDALMAHKDVFSVVNGIVMTSSFDGHDQNSNIFLTGSPFGGDSFLPLLNQAAPPTLPPASIDGVLAGKLEASLLNHGNVIPLDADSARKLSRGVKALGPDFGKDPVASFLRSRLAASGQGPGGFSAIVRSAASAFETLPSLAASIGEIQLGNQPGDQTAELAFLSVAGEMFKRGATRSAVYAPTGINLDTHAVADARNMPRTAAEVSRLVASSIKYLRETAFDAKRSLLDVTTVLVTSEFGRTMRQKDFTIQSSGTDHNPLSNSAILAGKGIRGGVVLGASDFNTPEETLSQAHLTVDKTKLKLMGRPFDFVKMIPRTDLPATFVPEEYMNPGSIINTVYSRFGLPETLYRKPFRNAPPSPVLKPLLA